MAGTYSFSDCRPIHFAISDGYAYVVGKFPDDSYLVCILDVSDPSNIASLYMSDNIYGPVGPLAVSGNYMYEANAYDLEIYDISDPTNPIMVSSIDSDWHDWRLAITDNYALLADYPIFYSNEILIMEISDPYNPQEITTFEGYNYINDITTSGDFAFVTDEWDGLSILNLSDIPNSYECGSYETQGNALSVSAKVPYVFVADMYSIEIFDCSQALNIPLPPKIPDDFYLYPAYPNPFNPSTTLPFSMHVGANVSLKIYDVTGRHVATLVDRWRDAGTYHPLFDASDLTSGVYFYRLETATFSKTQKMVLLK
jgi:hypothetical protein